MFSQVCVILSAVYGGDRYLWCQVSSGRIDIWYQVPSGGRYSGGVGTSGVGITRR